jgi:hypothetical protein
MMPGSPVLPTQLPKQSSFSMGLCLESTWGLQETFPLLGMGAPAKPALFQLTWASRPSSPPTIWSLPCIDPGTGFSFPSPLELESMVMPVHTPSFDTASLPTQDHSLGRPSQPQWRSGVAEWQWENQEYPSTQKGMEGWRHPCGGRGRSQFTLFFTFQPKY